MEMNRNASTLLILAWMTAGGFSGLAHAAESDRATSAKKCELKQVGSIDLIGETGVILPATIGSTPARMILNINSAATVVFEPAVGLFGWKRKSLGAAEVQSGSASITHTVAVEGFRFGNVAYSKAIFLVRPSTETLQNWGGAPVIGGLGMDVFANIDFELDLSRRKLNLFSQDHCAGKVVYWTDTFASAPMFKGRLGEMYFPIELDGKKIEATLNPQNPVTSLSTDVTKKLYKFDEHSAGNETTIGADGDKDYFYRAMAMTAPGLTISNARVQLTEPHKFCDGPVTNRTSKATGYDDCMGVHPLNLGYGVLQKLRIYVATKEKMIYYSSADAGR